MKAKIADLKRRIGQKQVEIEFKNKMTDLADETYGVDIKKNLSPNLNLILGKQRGVTHYFKCIL